MKSDTHWRRWDIYSPPGCRSGSLLYTLIRVTGVVVATSSQTLSLTIKVLSLPPNLRQCKRRFSILLAIQSCLQLARTFALNICPTTQGKQYTESVKLEILKVWFRVKWLNILRKFTFWFPTGSLCSIQGYPTDQSSFVLSDRLCGTKHADNCLSQNIPSCVLMRVKSHRCYRLPGKKKSLCKKSSCVLAIDFQTPHNTFTTSHHLVSTYPRSGVDLRTRLTRSSTLYGVHNTCKDVLFWLRCSIVTCEL